jgi:hypothetical protein
MDLIDVTQKKCVRLGFTNARLDPGSKASDLMARQSSKADEENFVSEAGR